MFRFSSANLGKALVLTELVKGQIAPATLAAITAAAKVGPVSALVAAKDAKTAAAAVAKVKGVEEVFAVSGDQYENGMPENLAPVVADVVAKNAFTHVFAGTSSFGKNIIPRAAAKHDSMPISEVSAIVDENTFVRQLYAGNVIATVESKDKIKFATIRGTSFDRAAPEGGSGKTTEVAAQPASTTTRFVKDIVEESDKPDLTTAPIVISGGRGMKNGDNFKILYELAAPLKAAVGATRAVVDAGYVPNDMQVGQTGKTVAPNLYLACGVSGAIQHVAGMKDSKVIAVVNTDDEAPFFQVADYGIVEDLFKVVPALTEKVKSR